MALFVCPAVHVPVKGSGRDGGVGRVRRSLALRGWP